MDWTYIRHCAEMFLSDYNRIINSSFEIKSRFKFIFDRN